MSQQVSRLHLNGLSVLTRSVPLQYLPKLIQWVEEHSSDEKTLKRELHKEYAQMVTDELTRQVRIVYPISVTRLY